MTAGFRPPAKPGMLARHYKTGGHRPPLQEDPATAGGFMKRLQGLFALMVILPIVALAQSGLKPQDLAQLQSVSEAQVSPDGTHIIYSVTHNDRPGAPYAQAWLMDVAGGKS